MCLHKVYTVPSGRFLCPCFTVKKNVPKWVANIFSFVALFQTTRILIEKMLLVGPFKYSLTGLHKSVLQYDTNRLLLCLGVLTWHTYALFYIIGREACTCLFNIINIIVSSIREREKEQSSNSILS